MTLERQFEEIRKLDNLLRILAKDRGHSTIESIQKRMPKNGNDELFPMDILIMVMEKLVREKYVLHNQGRYMMRGESVASGAFYSNYQISWDGKFFIENGGYEEQERERIRQAELDASYLKEIQSLKVRQMENEEKTIDLTWWLMLWTGIAAFYYTQEIMIYHFGKDRKLEVFLACVNVFVFLLWAFVRFYKNRKRDEETP
jgi:hypothetical protein